MKGLRTELTLKLLGNTFVPEHVYKRLIQLI